MITLEKANKFVNILKDSGTFESGRLYFSDFVDQENIKSAFENTGYEVTYTPKQSHQTHNGIYIMKRKLEDSKK